MRVDFKIRGEKELFKNLKTLDKEIQAKFLIQSANAGMNKIVKDARSRVKDDTGTLRKSIRRAVKIYKKGAVLYGIVGINIRLKAKDKYGNNRQPRYYAHIVEFYKPFMRPAYEANKRIIQQIFEKALSRRVKKAQKQLTILRK